MLLFCFCKEPGRRIHCLQMPKASSWQETGRGHPRALCPSVTSQAPRRAFSKSARRKRRMDRSLIIVTAVGTQSGTWFPPLPKGSQQCFLGSIVCCTGDCHSHWSSPRGTRGRVGLSRQQCGCHNGAECPLLLQGLSSACPQRPERQELPWETIEHTIQ